MALWGHIHDEAEKHKRTFNAQVLHMLYRYGSRGEHRLSKEGRAAMMTLEPLAYDETVSTRELSEMIDALWKDGHVP